MILKQSQNFRKEIKEPDEFVSIANRLMGYAVAHKNYLIGGGLFVVIGVLGFIGYNYYTSEQDEKASYAFKEVYDIINAKVEQPDKKTPDFMTAEEDGDNSSLTFKTVSEKYQKAATVLETIISKYKGTKTAKISTYYLGTAKFFLGDYDAAITSYEKAYDYFGGKAELSNKIRDSIGHSYEAKGDIDEAIENYALIMKSDDDFMKDYALYNLGRCYHIKKDSEKAKTYWNQLKEEHPQSMLIDLVDKRLASL